MIIGKKGDNPLVKVIEVQNENLELKTCLMSELMIPR